MNRYPPSKPSVLIIDDNITNIEVLAAALSGDYEISFATGGAEGIELAGKYRPDLILLDIMMPGMDGFETCRRLRGGESLPDIPVIFISALEEVADKVKAFQAGGNDYITKPFQPEEVLAGSPPIPRCTGPAGSWRRGRKACSEICRNCKRRISS